VSKLQSEIKAKDTEHKEFENKLKIILGEKDEEIRNINKKLLDTEEEFEETKVELKKTT